MPLAPPSAPDLEGFWDAMRRKREQLGEDVVFLEDAVVEWPGGTALDLNGEPLDPTVEPVASGQASATVRCDVFYRAIARGGGGGGAGEEYATAAGIHPAAHISAICDYAERERLEPATSMVARGELFMIVAQEPDQLGPGPPRRWLVHGRRE